MAVQGLDSGAIERDRSVLLAAAWALVAALPLIGLASLLMHAMLDPHWSNQRVHFVLFLGVGVGAVDFALAAAAGQARAGAATRACC